jgi:ubiquilin
MADLIKVVVRQSSGDQFDVEIAGNASVKDLKDACAEKQSAMKAEEMRLIFKGKILKDEMTLDEYKITDGLTIHLVKGKSAGASADTSSLSGPPTTEAGTSVGAGVGPGAGAAGANPFAGMPPGMAGMMGGMGGGMPPGMAGMGGMGGGMPPGMGQMNPQMMEQMMGNPMVQ